MHACVGGWLFDSDNGMLDDDFNGCYFIQIVHFILVALHVS